MATFFLQTKAAKENNKDYISFRSRHAGRSSAADIYNTASVVGIDMDVLGFVVALKLATPRQCACDYLTGKPFNDPTHQCFDDCIATRFVFFSKATELHEFLEAPTCTISAHVPS